MAPIEVEKLVGTSRRRLGRYNEFLLVELTFLFICSTR